MLILKFKVMTVLQINKSKGDLCDFGHVGYMYIEIPKKQNINMKSK